MGGMLTPSKESEIIKLIQQDNPKKLQDFLINNNIDSDNLYTKRKRTLIQLCCYFISPKCLSKLIEMNYDYNKKEISNNCTPLYIACKFNCLEIVKILLSQKNCKVLQKNDEDYNEFEISFLKGNYDICYYLLFEYKNNNNNDKLNLEENKKSKNNIYNDDEINTNIKIGDENNENKENNFQIDINNPYQQFFFSNTFSLDKYLSLQSTNQFPLFNMELFYESLINRVLPEKCESFAAERKRTKDLLTKIPDPNETWGHFFKRCANMELYNPPLVDKKNVSQMNSLYMSTQMKLIENEYGIKMNYYKKNEATPNVLIDGEEEEEEDEEPIIKVNNTEKKNLKEEIQNNNETKNDIDNNNNNTNNNVLSISIHHKRNKQRKLEDVKLNTKDNVCALNINTTTNTSDRPIKSHTQNIEQKE